MALYMLMAKYTPEAIKTIVEGDTDRAAASSSGMRSCGWSHAIISCLVWAEGISPIIPQGDAEFLRIMWCPSFF